MKQIIECVPNFSEGVNLEIIKQITNQIESVEGVKLLDVDPGKATNRTVVTLVGEPQAVIDAAFLAIQMASKLIDMRNHKGEHPRMGATDVCPLIPVANITLEETAEWAHKLGEKVGAELGIPVYMYEAAATSPQRKSLSIIRSGEYEGFATKILQAEWKPDYGDAKFNAISGATVIGARDFLVAYNVNLNTKSVKKANSVAFDVRENGRVKREGDPISGKVINDENGEPLRIPGALKNVKGIGWYIEEYGVAQVSLNLTNINETPLHVVFEEVEKSARERGLRVTGSELVGVLPLKCLVDAGKYFCKKQGRSPGVDDAELIFIAIKSMGLDELGPFDPSKKVIEYLLRDKKNSHLVNLTVEGFANLTASESPAPGGGSVAALCGTLGASLTSMVANLSSTKKGWESKMDFFFEAAENAQTIKSRLLCLIDEDTLAFDAIMQAMQLPKNSAEEKAERKNAIHEATKLAIEAPLNTMREAAKIYPLVEQMVANGNQNSVTDAAVGALCAHTAIKAAFMNVLINCKGFDDELYLSIVIKEAEYLMGYSEMQEISISEKVFAKIK